MNLAFVNEEDSAVKICRWSWVVEVSHFFPKAIDFYFAIEVSERPFGSRRYRKNITKIAINPGTPVRSG